MPGKSESESRKLLKKLKETLSEESAGQERLDKIANIIADSMKTHVCSVYLLRDAETLELCATQGLKRSAIHQTRLKIGEGLVGKVAKSIESINTENVPSEKGFRFMPETGEGIYSSFLGVPIQRLGKTLGRSNKALSRLYRG
jgi:phosphotransferase system enzyme I (PtsP)